MKTTFSLRATAVAALSLVALSGPIAIRAHAAASNPAASAASITPGGPGDFLIIVGKRTVWASSQKPAPLAVASPRSSAQPREFVIIDNKRVVRVSNAPQAAPVARLSRPYIKTDGHLIVDNKTTRWVDHGHGDSEDPSDTIVASED